MKKSWWQTEQNNPKLIFVAHSLGGLVVKQALLLASVSLHDRHRKILDATSGIVFFGTPHRGSSNDIARVLQYSASIGARVNRSNIRSYPFLEFSSQLGRIQEAFQEFQSRKVPEFQIISFFEELPIPGFGLVSEKVNLVAMADLTRTGCERTLCNTLFVHISSNTCKPRGKDWNATLFAKLMLTSDKTICKFNNPSESNYQRVLGELKRLAYIEIEKQSALNFEQELQGFQGQSILKPGSSSSQVINYQ